jgi:hypothetical protein
MLCLGLFGKTKTLSAPHNWQTEATTDTKVIGSVCAPFTVSVFSETARRSRGRHPAVARRLSPASAHLARTCGDHAQPQAEGILQLLS